MSNNNKQALEEMRRRLQKEKEEAKAKHQTEVVTHLTHEDTGPDFAKIAEELQKRHEEEKHGLNEGYVKETIYVEENISKAFNALCVKRGDKKRLLNRALAEFVEREHRKLME